MKVNGNALENFNYLDFGLLTFGVIMREIEFKMERPGLVETGQEVEITEHEAASGCSYIIEPAVAMSGCYNFAECLTTS